MRSLVLAVALAAAAPASAAFLLPSPYLCFNTGVTPGCGTADSPFKGKAYTYFHLETFEDGLLNTPGVAAFGGNVFGPAVDANSVDADDGAVDGLGAAGRSYIGPDGYEFRFDVATLGQLPTDVGIVVTNGGGGALQVDFLDMALNPAGSLFVGDALDGQTAGDRFVGITGSTPIGGIRFVNYFGGKIEVDHLQYGVPGAVPEPASWAMMIAGFGLVGAAARRRSPGRPRDPSVTPGPRLSAVPTA
jgi:hypothetical protein